MKSTLQFINEKSTLLNTIEAMQNQIREVFYNDLET